MNAVQCCHDLGKDLRTAATHWISSDFSMFVYRLRLGAVAYRARKFTSAAVINLLCQPRRTRARSTDLNPATRMSPHRHLVEDHYCDVVTPRCFVYPTRPRRCLKLFSPADRGGERIAQPRDLWALTQAGSRRYRIEEGKKGAVDRCSIINGVSI